MKKFIVFLFLLLPFSDATLRLGDGNKIAHIFLGTQAIGKIYKGDTLVWTSENPPQITAFSISPHTIDLDDRMSGTITFTFSITGTAGQVTNAQIVRLPNGANVGATFVAARGLGFTNQTLPNIQQPLQTTTYRIFATNSNGASHRDATVSVSKNPTLTNCRRTGFVDATDLYEFAFTLTGLPRPTVFHICLYSKQYSRTTRASAF